jgi:RNA-directed DNA polymerase
MINVAEEMGRLNKLAKRSSTQIRKPLWKLLTSPEWLAQAWEQIRNNKGSQTAGVGHQTATDVDLDLIHKLVKELKNGTYRPKPVRRVSIPKASDHRQTRPIGISTIKDRIVQQGIKMLLEPILEADFLDCSHGFRQGRSTITALRDVARVYPNTSWIIEGDIEGCFNNIPIGKLLELLKEWVADGKVRSLIRRFLTAGYLQDWQYHKTYSGIAQGNIVGPLLANLYLHQLDLFMVRELEANRTQTTKEKRARLNPAYVKLDNRIAARRRKLRSGVGDKQALISELKELERQRSRTPCYVKEKRHPGKIWYVRYADDFLILVAGNKSEAETIKQKVKERLSEMGLTLSEKKTKLTHWRENVLFLGYQLQGKLRPNGVGIRAVLSIPHEKVRKIERDTEQVSGYYHIPDVDVMKQLSDKYRGWCQYYRYATAPQQTFNKLANFIWWRYAHFTARKQKSSIKAMIKKERQAKRLVRVQKGGRQNNAFLIKLGKKNLMLDLFPPKTQQIRTVSNRQRWEADLKPVTPMCWQSGHSLATRLEALDRADGICERCRERPVTHIHHTVPLKGRSFLARVRSDRDQRYTAKALCQECHLAAHGGSYRPRKEQSGWNAGYAERCSPSVGSAE